jgi:hypothetical protein
MYLADVIFLVVLAVLFGLIVIGPVWAINRWRRAAPSRVQQQRTHHQGRL